MCYRERVASRKSDLKALRNLVSEAHAIIASTKQPEARTERARELLTAALHLADTLALDLADTLIEISPGVALGAKGGKQTAKRGPEYFRNIAAMRKHKGGRPKKRVN